MRTNVILATVAILTLSAPGAVWADLGGGGSSLGNNLTPSQSTPRYDAAKEYQNGVTALNAGDFKTADTSFNHVLSVAPRNLGPLLGSGMAKTGLKDFKGASNAYKKALSVDGNNVMALRGYALSLVSLGDTDGVGKQLDALKKRAAACAGTCADAADIQAAIAAIESATNTPGKQSSIAPPGLLLGDAKSGDRAYLDAVGLINQHRYVAAIASLKVAEGVFGPHPDVLTYIGFSYRKLGRYDTAESYYRQALALAPNHRGATEYYGELKVERGDVAGARKMLAKLDSLCSFGCVEAEDLRRWIAQGHG
jgi:Flp pilus assembly protein TadD